jgi:3-oxoacyl-(acyl-carrier-protein) synthase
MKAYIRSAACISAQNTLGTTGFLTDVAEYQSNRLSAIEPDYRNYADPKLIRRMSHIIKMGVAAAKECLQAAGTAMPDAIITGTALGVLEDTITFLTRIVELQEEMLPPTSFIQSTHNTVAAQIALMLQCHGYNNTFVHKGISFESAVQDALMLLNEGEARQVLVGGIDEMTDASFTVLNRLGLYRRQSVSNLALFKEPAKGTIGGEGAAFFILDSMADGNTMAELSGLKTIFSKESDFNIADTITRFLSEHALSVTDIDLFLTGKNGDTRNDEPYQQLKAGMFHDTALANYKHLSGEYATASAFALWVAANIVSRQTVPPILLEEDATVNFPKRILIYNHYQHTYHSLMLVSAC